MEPEDLLPCSQKFAIGPHVDSGEYIPSWHLTLLI